MPKAGMAGSMLEEDKLGGAYDSELMRRMLRYVRPYKGLAAAGFALTLGIAGLALVFPLLVREAVDGPMRQGAASAEKAVHLHWLTMIALMYVLAILTRFVFVYAQTVVLNRLGQSAMYDLRGRLFEHLEELDSSYHSRNPVGRLVTRVTNDIQALNEIFTSGLVAVFGDVFLILAILLLMFFRSWRLTLVALAIGPAMAVATLAFRTKAREFYREIRIRLARINTFLQENITGMSTIQMFLREQRNLRTFDEINADHRDISIQNVYYYALFFPTVEVFSSMATASVVYFGGRLIVSSMGAFNFGDFYLFWFLFGRLFEPIQHLAERYNILQAGMAAAERVFGILDTEPAIGAGPDPRPADRIRGEIEFRNVSFTYDSEPVLTDVSFHIAPGERIALVGATGGGKSTITNLIMRFYDVEKGAVLIDGVDIRDYDPRELRDHFGLVLQDVFLFTGTVRENIRLDSPEISPAQVEAAARHVKAHSFIERLPEGYDAPVGERGATFSSGERQLLAFARAVAFDPRILILDEATSSVDPETERLIQEALETLMKNRTSIVVAHRLSTIKAVDRIMVVHRGRIREEGTHDELLAAQGIYHKLYQLQYADQE